MKKLLAVVVILGLSAVSHADLLVGFDFTGYAGNEPVGTSTVAAANMTDPAYISRGAGLVASANGNGFRANNFASADVAAAITANDYFTWSIACDPGYSFSATNISFNWAYSSTGPNNMSLRSSVDGFAADVGTYAAVANGAVLSTALNLANQSAIEFRLYGYGNTATGGTAGFDGSTTAVAGFLTIEGTVMAIPEPATFGMMGLGLAIAMFLRWRRNSI